MKDKFIITIDGPAGAGKTTIAKKVAGMLEFNYVDTGAMYRAIALKFLQEGVDFTDTDKIEKIVDDTDISLDFSDSVMKIFLDGKNVTNLIRSEKVTENTSQAAAIPAVRYKLLEIQRRAADKFKRVVFEGRDMGSIVFPEADLKVYLDAGIEERAKRRFEELQHKGEKVEMEKLKEQIKKRDERDATRGLAPLMVPEDAEIIDSTVMSIPQVAEKVVDLLAE